MRLASSPGRCGRKVASGEVRLGMMRLCWTHGSKPRSAHNAMGLKMSSIAKHWKLLSVVAIVVFLAFCGMFAYITFALSPGDEAIWYTGEGVLLAVLALTAGVLAAIFTYPAYHDWVVQSRRKPCIALSVEVASASNWDQFVPVTEGHSYNIGLSGMFRARVSVHNTGDGTLRKAVLRIALPTPGKLRAVDNSIVHHFDVPGILKNVNFNPPNETQVVVTEARDEFTPSIDRIFHVEGEFPQSESGLFAEVSGDPPTYTNTKIFLVQMDQDEGPLP
jgi:hypothetical protein